jgi:hypothetical protein
MALLVGVWICAVTPVSADTIRCANPFPVRGTATEVIVETGDGLPIAGAEVSVVHRPGSEVESSLTVGTTDSRGRVSWTPAEPGIACLTAAWVDSAGPRTEQVNISIPFDRTPASGIIVAILAGLILYGTAAYMFGKLRS